MRWLIVVLVYLFLGLFSYFVLDLVGHKSGIFNFVETRYLVRFIFSLIYFTFGFYIVRIYFKRLLGLFLAINVAIEVFIILISGIRYLYPENALLIDMYRLFFGFSISPLDLLVVFIVHSDSRKSFPGFL